MATKEGRSVSKVASRELSLQVEFSNESFPANTNHEERISVEFSVSKSVHVVKNETVSLFEHIYVFLVFLYQ